MDWLDSLQRRIAFFLTIYVSWSILAPLSLVDAQQQPVTQVLDGLFAQYDKAVRPYYGEKPVEVLLSIYVLSIEEVNDANMDFTVTMYFRQTWTDPRLTFRPQRGISLRGQNNSINIDETRALLMWMPDTFSANEKRSLLHKDTSQNQFLRLNSTGAILKSTRYTMTFECPMNFALFPFDHQTCYMDFQSFAGTMNEIRFKVENNSIGLSPDASVPGFKVLGHWVQNTDISLTQGNYSRIWVRFLFQRSHQYYVIRCYAPIAAAVIVSLVSLLCANPVLAPIIHILNLFFVIGYSANAWILKPPMLSYLRLLDVYFLLCLAHILLCTIVSLIESYGQRSEEITETDSFRGIRNAHQQRKRRFCSAGNILICTIKLILVGLFVGSNIMYYMYSEEIRGIVNKYYLMLVKFSRSL